jgi:hypothetical protein
MDIPERDLRMFTMLIARGIEMHLGEYRKGHQSAHPGDELDLAEYLHLEIFRFARPEDLKAVLVEAREKEQASMSADPTRTSSEPARRRGAAGWLRRR